MEMDWNKAEDKVYIKARHTKPDGTVENFEASYDLPLIPIFTVTETGTWNIAEETVYWKFTVMKLTVLLPLQVKFESDFGTLSSFFDEFSVPLDILTEQGHIYVRHTHVYCPCEAINGNGKEYPYANTKEDYEALNSAYIGNHEYAKDRTAERLEKVMTFLNV